MHVYVHTIIVCLNAMNWHQWSSLGIVKSMTYPWNTSWLLYIAQPALPWLSPKVETYSDIFYWDGSWCIMMYHVYLLLACWPFKGGKRRRHIHGGTLPRVACWDISRRYLQVQQALPTPIRQPKPCHAFFKPFPAEPTTDQQRESYTQHSHVTRKILKYT